MRVAAVLFAPQTDTRARVSEPRDDHAAIGFDADTAFQDIASEIHHSAEAMRTVRGWLRGSYSQPVHAMEREPRFFAEYGRDSARLCAGIDPREWQQTERRSTGQIVG